MTEVETGEWYKAYEATHDETRNDALGDPGVLWQILAHDAAIARSLQRDGVTADARVLGVGCGGGKELALFVRLGFPLRNLVGVDLLTSRIEGGKARLPGFDLRQGDATALDLPDAGFDVVYESTMFAQLTDEPLRRRVAREMARVVRPGGLILLADWRLTRPRDSSERGVGRREVRRMFDGLATLERVEPAALAPPLGRRLSAHAPSLYFLVRRLLPFTASQVVYVLRKPA